ncbi:hypothetical protein OROGR_031128 [Orobanche gracilis]
MHQSVVILLDLKILRPATQSMKLAVVTSSRADVKWTELDELKRVMAWDDLRSRNTLDIMHAVDETSDERMEESIGESREIKYFVSMTGLSRELAFAEVKNNLLHISHH